MGKPLRNLGLTVFHLLDMICKMHIPDTLNSKATFVLMFKNIHEADRSG